MIPTFRLVDESYTGPHLIYTNMGDAKHAAHSCFSYVGRMDGAGQVVNLGAPGCLTIGKILHETLHALGLPIDLQDVFCVTTFQVVHMR